MQETSMLLFTKMVQPMRLAGKISTMGLDWGGFETPP
jgi:hypothetical protein